MRKRKNHRAEDHDDAGKELAKAEEQAVCNLVDVRGDPADEVAFFLPVDGPERDNLDLAKRGLAEVSDDEYRNPVIAEVQAELAERRERDEENYPRYFLSQTREIDRALADYAVDGFADQGR